MTQQQAMNRMMEDWLITSNNLHLLEKTFGPNAASTCSARTRKNVQEQLLKANGCVYSIVAWSQTGDRRIYWIFRAKQVKSLTRLLQSTLKRKKITDSIESSIVWEL
tara:strand:+ start:258 stop:578 length:321 start_codon:yes stop_codon:yes gene_type:complete